MLIAMSNRSPSTLCTTRRVVESEGLRRPARSAAATSEGRSAAHSAIATSGRAPVGTAHTATASTVTSPWRTPQRPPGSTHPGQDTQQTGRDLNRVWYLQLGQLVDNSKDRR